VSVDSSRNFVDADFGGAKQSRRPHVTSVHECAGAQRLSL
jgi:hypothetical protein